MSVMTRNAAALAATVTLTAGAFAGGGEVEPGACCYPDATCGISNVNACAAAGGIWQGGSTNCTTDDPDCYYIPTSMMNYQGRLAQSGVPVNDVCAITFSLWDADASGTQIGQSITKSDAAIVDGAFSVDLDFGLAAFAGRQRWLEITIDCPGEAPTTLSPRQPLVDTPYALLAKGAAQRFDVLDGTGTPQAHLFAEVDEDTGGWLGALVLGNSASPIDLEMDAEGLFFWNENTDEDLVGIYSNGFNGDPGMFFRYPSGQLGADMRPGHLGITSADGSSFAVMFIDPSNRSSIYAETIGADEINAAIKNFCIPNPNDPETDLWYACPEGPEAAAYVRGTATLVDGKAVIEFPAHFRSIVNVDSLTVQLTPRSADSLGLATIERTRDGFVVRELAKGTGNYQFDYYVMAVRTGYEDFEVVRPKRIIPGQADVTIDDDASLLY